MGCVNRERLRAFAQGQQDAEAADHVRACPACNAALQNMDTLDGTVFSECESVVPPTVPPQARRLGTCFELRRLLGEGGMGEVWLAYHLLMKCLCAIKMLRGDQCGRNALVRFEREIETYSRLRHPNVVGIMHADEIDGRAFFVMEYVDGCSLQALVQRHGRLRVVDACELARQAALGLAHAHSHGITHRDVKPANLMLGQTLKVKVVDFGLARDGTAGLTVDGDVLGTPEYMAPEQADRATQVDGRADLYALGCTLYFLLAGVPPYPRKGNAWHEIFAVLAGHRSAAIPSLHACRPGVPAGLASLIEKMLAKEPAGRPATASEVAAVLEKYSAGADLRRLLDDAPDACGEAATGSE
jgi:serine/threonine protein kinase